MKQLAAKQMTQWTHSLKHDKLYKSAGIQPSLLSIENSKGRILMDLYSLKQVNVSTVQQQIHQTKYSALIT